MNLENIIKSKHFKWATIVVGELIIILSAFSIGMFVGYDKANFSYRWGENYSRNFGEPRPGFGNSFGIRDGLTGKDFINAHGSSGSIIKIDNNTLIIKGKDNTEKTVVINDGTTIRKNHENIKVGDLKIDDAVVIIGNPNNSGQIEAKFIRVFGNN